MTRRGIASVARVVMLGALFVVPAACASERLPEVGVGQEAIVGGTPVSTCGYPTVVLAGGGCTGTLIHPRVVVTAAHCGTIRSVEFGESAGSGITRSVTCSVVPGTGTGADVQFCVLDTPVVDMPITPILYGCEVDMLSVGDEVVITGFGLTSFGATGSGGVKRWSLAPIRALRADITLIGTPTASACPGDSGGPVFKRMPDGTWRTFGTVSGGTTGIPCNGDGAYPRLELHVPWFETTSGIDITPCHDADGTWNAGPDCGAFFAGDHTGGESWGDFCAGAPAGPPSATCGEPNAGIPTVDAGGPPPTDAGAVTPDAAVPTDAALPPPTDAGDGSTYSDGCGCSTPGGRHDLPPLGLLLLGAVALFFCRARRQH